MGKKTFAKIIFDFIVKFDCKYVIEVSLPHVPPCTCKSYTFHIMIYTWKNQTSYTYNMKVGLRNKTAYSGTVYFYER